MRLVVFGRSFGARDVVPGIVILLLATGAGATFTTGRAGAEVVGVVGMIVGHGSAAVLMFNRAKRLPHAERRAWQTLAFALMLTTAGLSLFAAMGENAPVFGPADLFFAAGYAVVVLALARIARMDPDGPPWGLTMLDVTVGGIAAAALVWDLVLDDLGDVPASTLERFALSLYPVLDVAIIIGLCLVALRRGHYRFDARILLLAVGVGFQVAADILYLREGIRAEAFVDAAPRMWLFLLAAALFVAAAALTDRTPATQEFPERDVPLLAVIWPYLLASALIPIHIARVEGLLGLRMPATDATKERVILYAVLAVGLLVLVRQWIAIRHSRRRVERQRHDLISSVSHELRTPLTAVVGFLEVLDDESTAFSPAERRAMIEEASLQARHMSRTVTDLITLARDGGASLALRPAETSLDAIVGRASIEAQDVPLTLDVDDHALMVDGERLDQAVGHLIANGRKYGARHLHLRAGVRGGTLTVEVHDDGPGIPVRHLEAVWDQFDRGSRRLDSSNPGIGIGLAIVRAVAHAHGGSATYRRSELLGGSCFAISVPATTRPASPRLRELTVR